MTTSIRLYLDENIHPTVAEYLKSNGLDAETARDAGMLAASDAEHLAYATAAERAMFSHDITDFEGLAKQWARDGRRHGGILLAARHRPEALGRMIVDACLLYESLQDLTIRLPVAPRQPSA